MCVFCTSVSQMSTSAIDCAGWWRVQRHRHGRVDHRAAFLGREQVRGHRGLHCAGGDDELSAIPAPAHSGVIRLAAHPARDCALRGGVDQVSRPQAPERRSPRRSRRPSPRRPRARPRPSPSSSADEAIDETTAARGASDAARAGRSASSELGDAEVVDRGIIFAIGAEMPAQAMTPSITPPASSVARFAASTRPSGTDRSASTSASLRSMPITRSPRSRSVFAVVAPRYPMPSP